MKTQKSQAANQSLMNLSFKGKCKHEEDDDDDIAASFFSPIDERSSVVHSLQPLAETCKHTCLPHSQRRQFIIQAVRFEIMHELPDSFSWTLLR